MKLALFFYFHVYVSAPPCFDFGLPDVLGIAFGGFLIGVLLIGALWFIKIKTGKCKNHNAQFPVKYRSELMFVWIKINILLNSGYPTGLDISSTAANLPGKEFFFYFYCFFSSSYHLISFSLVFLQDVPAQERNDNRFPPTLPLLRTAAPTLALEAPRAHRPAAWHD